MKYTIIIDEQEKLPYSFSSPNISTKRLSLKTGDYTIEGHEGAFSLERKSLDDYTNSLLLERFYKELERLKAFQFKAVIVEGSLEQIRRREYSASIPSEEVLVRTSEIMIKYGIPVIFCGDRQHAIHLVEILTETYLNSLKVKKNVRKPRRTMQNKEDIL